MYTLRRIQQAVWRSRRLGLTLLLACMTMGLLQAEHIIGGVFTYTCLGYTNGDPSSGSRTYRFFLKVYRDCQGGGANFDSTPNEFTAHITIYLGSSTSPFQQLYLPAPTVNPVDPSTGNPCLEVPPSVCVEEGVYEFVVDLPISSMSYHLAYQRCCRNATLNNIVDPANSGATIAVELTAEAQNLCNNSPDFTEFPPAAICLNNPLQYDHSASDAEGDSLVYSLCSPLLGGGPNITAPFAFDGLAPDPDAPPPYQPVNYVVPTYSATQPLGPGANFSIDPQTGLLTGLPNQPGQFAVGVCVEEYRNGVLLSTTRRGFQFNVVNCQQAVEADIDEDGLGPNGELLLESCGELDINLVNRSEDKDLINAYEWTIDLGSGNLQTLNTEDLQFTFPAPGSYPAFLVANPGLPNECTDTAFLRFDLFPGVDLTANIATGFDSCSLGPVPFESQVVAPAGGLAYNWDFDDGQTSAQPNPVHTYMDNGDYTINLLVTDADGCADSVELDLPYFPLPADPLPGLLPTQACSPFTLSLGPLEEPVDSTYEVRWDFGDGTTASGISATHTYDMEGVYDLGLFVRSPSGCLYDSTLADLFDVKGTPVAEFAFDPEMPDHRDPIVRFTNFSSGASFWAWDFGGAGSSANRNPVFAFPDTGRYEVQLIATNTGGCADTVSMVVDVAPRATYFMPNAFTPNADGLNDELKGVGDLFGIRDFQFTVWDRWGQRIFLTRDPDEGWNGRKDNTGRLLPGGTYAYVISYTEARGRQVILKGQAVLVK